MGGKEQNKKKEPEIIKLFLLGITKTQGKSCQQTTHLDGFYERNSILTTILIS